MLKHRVLKLLSPNAAAPKGPWDGFRQAYHFDTSRLTVNNTKAGLLGGFLPALRWSWELGSGGCACVTDARVGNIHSQFLHRASLT
eukprot:SAG31_NODE_1758_length_7335_cov_18.704600_2_plen_86_part_00